MRRTLIAVAAGIAAVTLLSAGPAAAEDNSSFVSQSVPASMRVGIRVAVSLTFRNTGTTSWTPAGGYVLGSPIRPTARPGGYLRSPCHRRWRPVRV